jgi:hypothetical protein
MTTYRKPARLFQTDETFTTAGQHRIGVAVFHTRRNEWTWAEAAALPDGRYALTLNRASGARRYLAVRSEFAAWEYLNNWARTTRGVAAGTSGLPPFLTSARMDITIATAKL